MGYPAQFSVTSHNAAGKKLPNPTRAGEVDDEVRRTGTPDHRDGPCGGRSCRLAAPAGVLSEPS